MADTFYSGNNLLKLVIVTGLSITHLFAQSNPEATSETRALYESLRTFSQHGVMLGHQDALAYGLDEGGERWLASGYDRSDIRSVTGQHPAVIGYDLGYLELGLDRNLDGVPFDHIRESILATYRRGGVNTISWHGNNPLDLSKTSWDSTEKTIPAILFNRENRDDYLEQLDQLVEFFGSLKGPEGELIPVIFRPFHEHTGSWFWWGADHCTAEEYKEFWRLTVEYLRRKQVNNLLFCYSTDYFNDENHYLERYPGDEYVDILGFDSYHRDAPESNTDFVKDIRRMAAMLEKIGMDRDKPRALTETGLEQLPVTDWWSEVLVKAVKDTGLSYVLVWRNGRPDHYYAPFPGQNSAQDLKRVVEKKQLLLEEEVKAAGFYKRK